MRSASRFVGSALALALAAGAASAQDYPNRPITLIVPFSAGGTSDVIARLAAEHMSKTLGQQIINENTVGAGGTTALTRLSRAAPDGYAIGIGNSGTNAASYIVHKHLIKYQPDAFVPIGLVGKTLPLIAIRKDFPAKDLKEFIAYAKANPSKVNLGHAGVGSSNYLICKAFVQAADINVTLVSYRGAAPALTDVMAGQVDGVCDAAASLTSTIQGGAVKGLVLGSASRLSTLPDVPSAPEAGLPAFILNGWNGFFAPKGTPEPILKKLNAALREAVATEQFKKRMEELGSVPASGEELTPEFVAKLVPTEIERSRRLIGDDLKDLKH